MNKQQENATVTGEDSNLTLEKSASDEQEQQETEQGQDTTPDKPFSEVKKTLQLKDNMVAILPPSDKTESGIILPDGVTQMDEKEYRPMARKVADNIEFVEEGDRLILHPNADEQAIPIQYKGHLIFLIHEQFVMGKEVSDD